MTCLQPNLHTGRGFQALPGFNQRRKLTLGMVLETQADHQRRKLTLEMVLETQADHYMLFTCLFNSVQ